MGTSPASELPPEVVSSCLTALKRFQNQHTGPEGERRALSTLVEWLGRVEEGASNDEAEPLDDSSLAYLHSYRDQFTRISLISRGHGEVVGDSPKVATSARDRSSPLLAEELDKADEWGAFDVFKVRALSRGKPLQAVALAVLHRFDLVEKLRLPEAKLRAFLRDVEEAYLENPYHSSTHAADVTQGLCALFAGNGFAAALTDLEMLSMVFACAIHDIGHPGVTNEYLVNTGAEAALTYNDASVNENGHAALAFRLLRKPANNFLEAEKCDGFFAIAQGLPNEQYRFVRQTIIGIVLATDMVGHARLTKEFSANVRALGGDLRVWPEEPRARALAMLVHACDIGNPAKPLRLSLQWSERIIAENFAQGDREAAQGLAVSPLCDRERVDVPKSQITFLDYVVAPCFEALRGLAPATAAEAAANIGAARAHWDAQPRRAPSVMFPLDDVR